MPFWIGEVCCFPELGDVLPAGTLRVPTCGQAEDGERWDGSALLGPGFVHYTAWKEIIESKEPLRRQRQAEQNLARGNRRRSSEPALDEAQPKPLSPP